MENCEKKVSRAAEAADMKEASAPPRVAGRSGILFFTWGALTNAISHGAVPPWQDFFTYFCCPFPRSSPETADG